MTVDTLGLVLRVLVTAANVGDREGGKQVLKRVKQSPRQTSRLTTIWVDGGFDGEPFMQWVMDFCRWIIQVVLRPEQAKGFTLLKNALVVERTYGWLMGTRRLVRDYELLPETSLDFYLPCHDPYYGEVTCLNFDGLKLFKHPLKPQQFWIKLLNPN